MVIAQVLETTSDVSAVSKHSLKPYLCYILDFCRLSAIMQAILLMQSYWVYTCMQAMRHAQQYLSTRLARCRCVLQGATSISSADYYWREESGVSRGPGGMSADELVSKLSYQARQAAQQLNSKPETL